MKFKFKKNKKTGEVLIGYSKVKDQLNLRFYVLSEIFKRYSDDITIILDTNRCANDLSIEQIETLLTDSGIEFHGYKVHRLGNSILGFNVSGFRKNKVPKERMFILSLIASQFTREIFDQLLSQFDLAVGIDMVCEKEKFSDEVRVCGLENVLLTMNILSIVSMIHPLRCR